MKSQLRQNQVRTRHRGKKFAAVMHSLETASCVSSQTDFIVDEVRQCPDAFKAGELLGKMFDALRYDRDDSEDDERLLPPAGIVMPLF